LDNIEAIHRLRHHPIRLQNPSSSVANVILAHG
jgi:hypothetical protein